MLHEEKEWPGQAEQILTKLYIPTSKHHYSPGPASVVYVGTAAREGGGEGAENVFRYLCAIYYDHGLESEHRTSIKDTELG